jgi:hypothetical protein
MNNYFTRVINMILAFDGDVVKFAGDSMIVMFTPSPAERAAAKAAAAASAAVHAAASATRNAGGGSSGDQESRVARQQGPVDCGELPLVVDDGGFRAAALRCARCAYTLATRLGAMRMKMNGQARAVHGAMSLTGLMPEWHWGWMLGGWLVFHFMCWLCKALVPGAKHLPCCTVTARQSRVSCGVFSFMRGLGQHSHRGYHTLGSAWLLKLL